MAAIAILAAAVAFSPTVCRAEATLTVQVAAGGAVAGGVGVFIWFSRSYDLGLRRGSLSGLLGIHGGQVVFGLPLPVPSMRHPGYDPESPPSPGWSLPLVRWSF